MSSQAAKQKGNLMATVAPSVLTEDVAKVKLNNVQCLPVLSELVILAADLVALSLPASILSMYFHNTGTTVYIAISVLAILLAFLLFRLYPGLGLHPVTEIRRVSTATAVTIVAVFGAAFRHLHTIGDAALIFACLAGMMLTPFFRSLMRNICVQRKWWGYPVFVVGDRECVRNVILRLQKHPQLGFKPVAVFSHSPLSGTRICGVPAIGDPDLIDLLAREHGIGRVIVAVPGSLEKDLMELMESKAASVSHILFVTNLSSPSSLETRTADMAGMLTIEMPRTLLLPGSRAVKRAIDLALTLTAGLFVAPFMGLICLLIKLDSPGPVFYGHLRIGRGSQMFKVWKFRSMVVNGDEILKQHFRDNPEAADEWQRTQKLKNDPRITRMGRFLRRTSLDELPQLWNVLRGEMSLIGPRPIVKGEMVKYGSLFSHYLQVAPGLTGLWQVSGRNNTTYEERVELDSYYVRNWSPWLDLYLLARTFVAVISKQGAY
jgi:Undecaprenyl-phosphate galactose phosphotransferase WbaP